MLNATERALVARIVTGKNPVCFHAAGQGLVDTLCTIIREQSATIEQRDTTIARFREGLVEAARAGKELAS